MNSMCNDDIVQSDRKLASIQRIDALRSIDGADAIEVADVLGWHVVVRKGEFQVGDLCVYCEIDSVLPERPEYEFLRPRGFRIKTVKLRGQISQGIAFPIMGMDDAILGDDVTERMGIVKFTCQMPAVLRGFARGAWPTWLVRTDQERIQTCREILHRPDARDPEWWVTEKLDGTSFTAVLRYTDDEQGEFHVCSRNLDLKLEGNDDNLYVKVAKDLHLERRMRERHMYNIAIQGEIIGPGIQKNRYQRDVSELRVFAAFNTKTHLYLTMSEMKDFATCLGIETVPILEREFVLPLTVDELVEYASGPSVVNPQLTQREGVVIRHRRMADISFKVINPLYLLKYQE